MDKALDQFLTSGTMIFAVSIVIVTFFVRRIIETAWPTLRKKADENSPYITYSTEAARWYQTVYCYAIPVVIGALLCLLRVPYFFPESVSTAVGGRMFFGMVVGWFSSAVYKVVKKILAKQGIDLPSPTSPPPGPPTS